MVVQVSRDISKPLASWPEFIFQPASIWTFLKNILAIVVSHGSRHLVEIHVGSVLVFTPQSSNNLRVIDLECAMLSVFPANKLAIRGSISQQLQNELPQGSRPYIT